MSNQSDSTTILLLSEIFMIDQLARGKIAKVLPKGMELSHFSVLNHLAHVHGERSPAELARAFNVTRGAMTNTLSRLEIAGFIHIRPDWNDARRKFISLSPAGRVARDEALVAVSPIMRDLGDKIGENTIKDSLPTLRALRRLLAD